MGFGNLGRRLVLGGELEQDSPVDKAVAGGEEQCSPVDKAADKAVAGGEEQRSLVDKAAAEEGIDALVEDDSRRPVAMGFLLGPHSPMIRPLKPLVLS